MPTTASSVWDYVVRRGPRDCWPFVGTINSEGYGVVYLDGGHRYAHVLVCEERWGPMRPGEVVRHMCAERSSLRIGMDTTAADRFEFFDRRCCQPDHLTPGSQRANALDRERARRARG
jgi:hypothetical protein